MIFNLMKKNIDDYWMIKFENKDDSGYMYLYKFNSHGQYKIIDHMWVIGTNKEKVICTILECGLDNFKIRIIENILYLYLDINTKIIDIDNITNISYEKRMNKYTYSIICNNGQEIIFSSVLQCKVSLNKLFKYLKVIYSEISYV